MRPATRPRIVVHVGEPKTGTTFLQQVMWRNRAALAQQGLLLPGARPFAHWRAAQDLREVPQPADDPVGPFAGAWAELAGKALTAPRVGVISHELLAAATAGQAARAISSLEGGEVHVVLTVRDMATLLPAEWQESVKHRSTRDWAGWLTDVIDRESVDPHRTKFWFWKVHDTMAILRNWTASLPPDRVHVVTTPPAGSPVDLLWRRFATVLDIDPASANLSRAKGNQSLGIAETELLRRLNSALPAELPDWAYMHEVKEPLAQETLTARRPSARLELPANHFRWARRHAAEVIAALERSGVDVIGDLLDLEPRADEGPVRRVADVTDEELVEVAVTALAALVTRNAGAAPTTPAAPTVRAAVLAAAGDHRTLDRLVRSYRLVRRRTQR